ncbi:MAG: diaminopimelate decarboxylase/aspartate kinase, partial [Kiritimatiellia bacterium]
DDLGPTWSSLQGAQLTQVTERWAPWWMDRRADLLALAQQGPCYVYDRASLRRAADDLVGLQHVERVFFAMKANPNPAVLRTLAEQGLGIECVSPGELARVKEVLPELSADRILFTPNFAGRQEYVDAMALGCHVTLDNLHPLEAWPEVFAGRSVQVRIDPGHGRGHHDHVRTAGARSKFGVSVEQLDRLEQLADQHDVNIVGLHAHNGSGVLNADNWAEVAVFLAGVARRFPNVRYLDLGGGLGVPERPGQPSLDLAALDASLARVRQAYPHLTLWLEPGRYLVAQAGVLLARVTQLKQKADLHYIGIETGMNSLIRPALYGSWHEIVNLSRLDEPATTKATVVGPICESGDTLGRDRMLPPTVEGDVLLIDVAGAYGRCMSSEYNLREPAREVVV